MYITILFLYFLLFLLPLSLFLLAGSQIQNCLWIHDPNIPLLLVLLYISGASKFYLLQLQGIFKCHISKTLSLFSASFLTLFHSFTFIYWLFSCFTEFSLYWLSSVLSFKFRQHGKLQETVKGVALIFGEYYVLNPWNVRFDISLLLPSYLILSILPVCPQIYLVEEIC